MSAIVCAAVALWALRRSDDALIDAVNAALKGLLDDGTIRSIYARYGIEHRRP